MEICPYSPPPYEKFTDDHIFPQFLGGRRTVRVCKQCNDVFGHTFEGRASQQLKRLQVFISHFGLNLTRTPASWPAAIVIDGATYDLQSGPEGAQYVLSKPTFTRDDEGKIVGGKARSVSEAKQITGGLIKAGKANEVEIFTSEDKPLDDVSLTGSFSFDEDLVWSKISNALKRLGFRSHNLWFIKTKRRRVFDAGGASLENSALHGMVFDRSGRPQKRAGEARLPGSGRESPSDPDSEEVRFGAGNC